MSQLLNSDRLLILDLSQKLLEQHLDLLGTGLLDSLVDQKVLSEDEFTDITSSSSEEQQVSRLLKRLRRKTNQQFDKVCQILQFKGLGHIYDELLSPAIIEQHVALLQKKLYRYFTEDYNMVDMFTIHDVGHQILLDNIYIPVKCATYHLTPDTTFKKTVEQYTDIFTTQQGNIPKLIVLTGEPMAGKTTFVRKVCNDWAVAQHQMKHDEQNHIAKLIVFRVVLPIILRLVKPGTNLSQILQRQLNFLTFSDMQIIQWLLKEEPNKVLLILDGLDEFLVENSEDIFSIMTGVLYPDIIVAITSRAEGLSKIDFQRSEHVCKVEASLEGFDLKHMKAYIEKYFMERASSHYDELIRLLETDDWGEILNNPGEELREIAINPGRLGIMCLLWSHNKRLSTDRVELFTDFVCIQLKLASKKLNLDTNTPCSKDKLLSTHKDLLCKFGKLANQRKDGTMCTVFTLEEVENIVGKNAMKYGFLYKSHPVTCWQDSEVSFVHKSIQEWLAAFFVAHDKEEIQQLQYSTKGDFLQDASWHGFLLSLLDNKSDLVISMILKTFVPYLKQAVTMMPPGKHEKTYSFEGWLRANGKYFINFLTKCNDAIAIPDDMLKKYPYPSCLAILLAMQKCYPKKAFLYGTTSAEEFHCLVKTLGNVQLQAECLSVSANMCHESDGNALGELLSKMPKCTNLHLRQCSLTATALKALLPAIKSRQDKIQINLAQNNVHGGGLYIGQLAICSSPSKKNLCGLESLDVSACQLTLSDLQDLVDFKIKHKYFHVKQLDLSDNTFTWGGEFLGKLMICPITTSGHCCGFEKLDIANCGLTLSDLHSIVDKTKNKNVHIKKLDLSGNNFAGGGKYVGKLLMLSSCCTKNQHSGLDELYVCDCNLATKDLLTLVESLPTLEDAFHASITNSASIQVHTQKLYMSGNNFSGGGRYVASLMLGNNFHLEVLDISQCSLTTSDLMSIEEKIRSKTGTSKHVKQLNMSGNQFNGGGALVAVIISNKQRNGLKDLDVGNCGLTTTDLQAMSKSIFSYQYWTYWYAEYKETTDEKVFRLPSSFHKNHLGRTLFHDKRLDHTMSLSDFMKIWRDTEEETKETDVHVNANFWDVSDPWNLIEVHSIRDLPRFLAKIPDKDFKKATVVLYSSEKATVHIPRTYKYIVRITIRTQWGTVNIQPTEKDLINIVQTVKGITTDIPHDPNQSSIIKTVDHIMYVTLQMNLASQWSIEKETRLSPPDVWQECLTSVRHLGLYLNNFTGGGQAIGELMLKLFSSNRQYLDQKEFNLSSCGLTTGDLQDIVKVIKGKQVYLQRLDLRNNAFEASHIFDELVTQLPGCDIVC